MQKVKGSNPFQPGPAGHEPGPQVSPQGAELVGGAVWNA
jgi:hypothetical protein